MPYVDRVLQEGESVRHIARISWVTYLPGLFLWAVAGVLAGLLPSAPALHFLVLTVAAIVFIIGTILLARAWFHMDKVESVDVDQSILGRLLDYGDVIIHGTGMGIEPLPNIDHPLELRNHITAV